MANPKGEIIERPDPGQLHGGPDRPRVLHLDARCPQGPGRHRPAYRRLGLPHPAPGRRRAGRHHPRARLRHRRSSSSSRSATTRANPNDNLVGRFAGEEIATKRGRVIVEKGAEIDRAELADIFESFEEDAWVPVRSVLKCEAVTGVCQACYGRSHGLRPDRPDRRRGRHHRRAVDRRAGHAADHADVPHRRRRRRGHHARPAACRGALRGAQAQGPRADHRARRRRPHRGDRQGPHRRHHRRRGRGAPPHVPAPHAPVRVARARRSTRAASSTRARCTRTTCSSSAAGPRPPATSSRRCRRSTSPRAWTSTTSTSS